MANVLSQLANQGQFATGLDRPSGNPVGQWAQGVAQRTMNPLATLASEADRYRTMPPEELLGQFGGGGVGATAYHGSPHLFDKFKSEAIGTGEGAQAYGHGLYLAESPDVAKTYSDLQGVTEPRVYASGERLPKHNIISSVADDIRMNGDVIAGIKAKHNGPEFVDAFNKLKGKKIEQQWDKVYEQGNLYKTDIPDAHINKMLDWDKPLSEQSADGIKQAVKFINEKAMKQRGVKIADMQDNGASLYKKLIQFSDNEAAASEKLRELGIPGIKYLDAGSREAGGTRNFVMFDPSDIRILERNSQPTGQVPWSETNRLSQMAGGQ